MSYTYTHWLSAAAAASRDWVMRGYWFFLAVILWLQWLMTSKFAMLFDTPTHATWERFIRNYHMAGFDLPRAARLAPRLRRSAASAARMDDAAAVVAQHCAHAHARHQLRAVRRGGTAHHMRLLQLRVHIPHHTPCHRHHGVHGMAAHSTHAVVRLHHARHGGGRPLLPVHAHAHAHALPRRHEDAMGKQVQRG